MAAAVVAGGDRMMFAVSIDEAFIVQAFCRFLENAKWDVDTEVDFVDVVAHHHDGRTLYAEAKGHTAATGLDIDTMYGQLLRRMKVEEAPSTAVRYGAVVPYGALDAARRVPAWVRAQLRIDIYAVHDDGRVEPYSSSPMTDADNFE